jgi:TolB-like protein/Tfp pilus assembly protein PilF
VQAATFDGLRDAHARGLRRRLRDARADLPTAFVRIVDRATAPNPDERYATAGTLEADLVRSLDETATPAITPAVPVPIADEPPPRRRPRAVVLAALAAAVVVLAIVSWRALQRIPAPGPSSIPGQISVLAVLPFQNLSTDPGEAYLASAVPMELTARLGQIGAVKVVPWTFMKRFDGGGQRSLRDVAARTGAQAVIEGSVQRVPAAGGTDGRPMQVRVQVFQAGTGSLLWSGSFERDLGDFFALQVEIAKEVASRIHVVVATREQIQVARSRVVPPEAMEHYLAARYMMDVQSNLTGAVQLLQRAIQIAPAFAEAHATLAYYYALESAYFGSAPSTVALRRAVGAADRAIDLDDRLAPAWSARAFARFALEWNWIGAEADFERALEIDPNSVPVLIDYADYLSHRGRHDDAIEAARKAQDRAPLSAEASRQLAYAYYMAHQFENAIGELRRTFTIEPDYVPAHTLLARAYLLTGKTADGIAELERAGEEYWPMLALAYAKAGRRVDAEHLLAQISSAAYTHPVIPYEVALVHAALGNADAAVEWFDKAYRERSPSMTALAVDPMVEPVRSDPRVQALLTRVGLRP